MDEGKLGKLGEQMARANRAAQLLNDQAFVDAVNALRQELINDWVLSEDREMRERIWLKLHLLVEVTQGLGLMVSRGREAQRQFEQGLSTEPKFNIA